MNSLIQGLFKQWSSRKYNLASYIQIEEGQVFFNLNEQALRKIYQVRIRNFSLYVPCHLRLRLLRDALLKREVRTFNNKRKTEIYLQPGLTFYTCYSDDQESQKLDHSYFTSVIFKKKKLLRSVVSPDGDILHQICNSFLQYPDFLEISAAHHWLTAQLLNHIHTNFNWIPRFIGTIFTIGWGLKILTELVGCLPPTPPKNIADCYEGQFRNFIPLLLFWILWILWVWLQPLIIQWVLARMLSFLEE